MKRETKLRKEERRKEAIELFGLKFFICLTIYQTLMGYLMPKFDQFVISTFSQFHFLMIFINFNF